MPPRGEPWSAPICIPGSRRPTQKRSARNSYPGNLPRELEREKLARLTDRITERFGTRPTVYLAGRYGLGPNTATILEELGYEVDLSPCVPMDFTADGGPDYSGATNHPYWFGEGRRLLGLPCSGDFVGWMPGNRGPLTAWPRIPAWPGRDCRPSWHGSGPSSASPSRPRDSHTRSSAA